MKTLIFTVWFLAISAGFSENRELYTHTYVVPPNFLKEATPDQFQGEATARNILEANGITFGDGTSAVYNPRSSQIIIRNTLDQLALVEQLMEAIREQGSFQVQIRFYEASFEGNPFQGEDHDLAGLFDFEIPKQSAAKSINDRAALIDEMRRVPRKISRANPGIESKITGVFTEPQFDFILPILKEAVGVAFRELPPVMVRSGQPGLVQVDNQRYGIIPTVGADRYTIEMEAFLPPHGRPLLGPDEEDTASFQVTIWDDQIIAYHEVDQNGPDRIVFIHGQLVDPAGFPLNAEKDNSLNSEPVASTAEVPQEPGLPAAPGNEDSEAPKLRQSEVDRIHAADQAALEGIQHMEQQDYGKATEALARAKILLPDHPLTEKRRDAYNRQFIRARELQTEQASRMVESHLVRTGDTLFSIARKYGLSVARLKEANRFSEDTLEPGQILLIPEERLQGNLFPESSLEDSLKKIVIREINLEDASLENALARFRQDLIEHENPMLPEIDAQLVLEEAEQFANTKITLRLSNVPAAEALRYITSLARCSYEIDGSRILITPVD